MSTRTRHGPRAAARTLPAAASLVAAVAVAGAILTPGDSGPLPVEALRVTSAGGIATGFVVADDRVVTVAHAVEEPGPVRVRTGPRVLLARVLVLDRTADLALLDAPGVRAPGGHEVETARVRGGAELRLVRVRDPDATGEAVHVRRAIVAHMRAPGATRSLRRPALELRARVRAGDSGAPLLTESGAVAGVTFAASRNREDTAYAVGAGALVRLLRR